MPQTTTIETVSVVRPLKVYARAIPVVEEQQRLNALYFVLQVLALVCLLITLALVIVACAVPRWLRSENYSTGLFEECVDASPSQLPLPEGAPRSGCQRVFRRSGNGMPSYYSP